ncbi:hypothetical protein PF005_g7528 [Phytophthora fragariae]|uniref:Uncharacterized protein n=1 Tax=Phytophthora fragariae TaxID=53985 RepID=A0A6A3FQP7_9STRA|nr:hypothetical protein PF009_g4054 [Phytophthora fragariae]KAE9029306.1 hypothetical protein PF011_g1141 [Phytophthora fragariae]KAE9121743.1 hypothetical protein PF007_g7709 [Phytophthora fragariae]KAE9148830.1 hypothetical protein PF006_g6631 [Phytophthora fragariae]KAE9220288.1 hypothetical protein PF005_g7528 [Phytophthora fragariae]
MTRVYRRGGAAASPASSTPAAWNSNNEKTSPSPEHESGSSEEHQAVPKVPAATRSNKWSALRREILPSPALMTISEKVQRIIEMLKKQPEDRSESDILSTSF